MAIYSRPRPVSNLSQTLWFPALESKEGLGRYGRNVVRLMSVIVAWLALTHKTEMHGEMVFVIAWCCQPYRMGHGQHLNPKMDMDGSPGGGIEKINTLRPRQNGRRFADDTFKCFFLNENVGNLIEISLKFVPKSPINNIPALVQIMAWRRSGDKPSHYPNQWWLVYWRIYASLGLNELKDPPTWLKAITTLDSVRKRP